jgi:hypothetical protein
MAILPCNRSMKQRQQGEADLSLPIARSSKTISSS